jgi:hypothetical protein
MRKRVHQKKKHSTKTVEYFVTKKGMKEENFLISGYLKFTKYYMIVQEKILKSFLLN